MSIRAPHVIGRVTQQNARDAALAVKQRAMTKEMKNDT